MKAPQFAATLLLVGQQVEGFLEWFPALVSSSSSSSLSLSSSSRDRLLFVHHRPQRPTTETSRRRTTRVAVAAAVPEAEQTTRSVEPASRDHNATIWSYIFNIHRSQTLHDEEFFANDEAHADVRPFVGSKDQQQQQQQQYRRNRRLLASRSLLRFLTENQLSLSDNVDLDQLRWSVILALRSAAQYNDYRLIMNLLSGISHYMRYGDNQNGDDHETIIGHVPQQTPTTTTITSSTTVLAEAIQGLCRTSASFSKIQQIWITYSQNNELGQNPTVRDVNAMLLAYQKHGRVRGALTFYRQQANHQLVDSYSLASLLTTLQQSIVDPPPAQLVHDDTQKTNKTISSTRNSPHKNDSTILVLQEMAQSPCWQWHEAIQVLQEYHRHRNMDDSTYNANILCSHLLQLNERIVTVFPSHNGPFMAKRIRDDLFGPTLDGKNISELDAVTTTLLIRGLNHWKEAEPLARRFPDNPYVYSAAISVCGKRFDLALNLYQQYSDVGSNTTAVANAVLNTCAGRNRPRERLAVAMSVVDEMTIQDTITWNSLLAVIVATRRFLKIEDWQSLEQDFSHWFESKDNGDISSSSVSHNERLVLCILSKSQVTCNAVTYKHAVQAIGPQGISRLLTDYIPPLHRSLDLYNQAFAAQASSGNLDQMFRLLSMMQKIDGIDGDDDTQVHIIQALGASPNSRMEVSSIVLGVTEDSTWAVDKATSYGINLRNCLSSLGSRHWAVAIEACMRAGDYEGSERLFRERSKVVNFSANDAERIATAYTEISLKTDPSKAASAYKIVSSLREPSMTLLKQGVRACVRAGLWDEVRVLLKRVHQYVLQRPGERVARGNMLGGLHREILKGCSRQGNLTVALGLCQDIHSVSRQLVSTNATTKVGMGAMEWKYFITTAAKSGNWKICLSTLQHLRAPLIAANPIAQPNSSSDTLRGHYLKLESTLNHAVRCFAKSKQFAWILRVIDDWMEWSGRPPPLAAARAAVRCFAEQQKVLELNTLLAKLMAMNSTAYNMDKSLYREWVYVSAITTLYNKGLYEYADDQFVAGVAHGAIQFRVTVENSLPSKKCITLDLHGMNLALAHSAVSIALQREASYHKEALANPIELMIITGKGMNSKLRLRPILRPAVQQMLIEEFYPPLSTLTAPGNTGVLVIPPGEISSWLDYQCQQRGVKMLLVAAMLKHLTVKVVSRINDLSEAKD